MITWLYMSGAYLISVLLASSKSSSLRFFFHHKSPSLPYLHLIRTPSQSERRATVYRKFVIPTRGLRFENFKAADDSSLYLTNVNARVPYRTRKRRRNHVALWSKLWFIVKRSISREFCRSTLCPIAKHSGSFESGKKRSSLHSAFTFPSNRTHFFFKSFFLNLLQLFNRNETYRENI